MHGPSGVVGDLPGELLRSMIGHRIRRISYKMSDFPGTGIAEDTASLVHEVDHAVVISIERSSIIMEWSIHNYDEFLHVTSDLGESKSAGVTCLVDVGDLPAWHRFQESEISGFGVATHESEDTSDLVWALRIDVAAGASVVIALGQLRQGIPAYQPDNLLVIFRPEVAQSLQVLDAPESAWGRRLTL
jgi:hypothetical protein